MNNNVLKINYSTVVVTGLTAFVCSLLWYSPYLFGNVWMEFRGGLGFWLWLAFHAVGMAGAVIWDNMPWMLGAVHAGDWLMKMLLMAVILSVWRGKSE